MKTIHRLSLLLVIVSGVSGCIANDSPTTPVQVDEPLPALTITSPSPSPTSTLKPTETITIPLATLESEQAKETIRNLLQEPVDCDAPCFWGITPEQTALEDASDIFARLGLQLIHTNSRDNKDFYAITYNLDDGLEITAILTVQNSIVKSIDMGINDSSQDGIPRKWSAYSPETLIERYGAPSRVDFFLGRVAPTPTHAMVLYFEAIDLIVGYSGSGILSSEATLEICPLTNDVDFIKIWMGENPRYPPSQGISLEEAALLTIEEFSRLMMGTPEMACFSLNEEAFP